MMADRIRQALADGPLWPEELYAELWPGRGPEHGERNTHGGPSNREVAVHRILGRRQFRGIAERMLEYNGKYGRYRLRRT